MLASSVRQAVLRIALQAIALDAEHILVDHFPCAFRNDKMFDDSFVEFSFRLS